MLRLFERHPVVAAAAMACITVALGTEPSTVEAQTSRTSTTPRTQDPSRPARDYGSVESGGLAPTVALTGFAITTGLTGAAIWSAIEAQRQRDRTTLEPSEDSDPTDSSRDRRTGVLAGAAAATGIASILISLFATNWSDDSPPTRLVASVSLDGGWVGAAVRLP